LKGFWGENFPQCPFFNILLDIKVETTSYFNFGDYASPAYYTYYYFHPMANTLTPKVLIIEDDAINAFVLQKFIEKKYTAVMAKNGHEALHILQKETFSVILMDINLGDEALDGVQLLQKIRAIPSQASTTVFAVTSFAMRGDKEAFLKAGFDQYFSKPIEHSVIMKAIEEVVS